MEKLDPYLRGADSKSRHPLGVRAPGEDVPVPADELRVGDEPGLEHDMRQQIELAPRVGGAVCREMAAEVAILDTRDKAGVSSVVVSVPANRCPDGDSVNYAGSDERSRGARCLGWLPHRRRERLAEEARRLRRVAHSRFVKRRNPKIPWNFDMKIFSREKILKLRSTPQRSEYLGWHPHN